MRWLAFLCCGGRVITSAVPFLAPASSDTVVRSGRELHILLTQATGSGLPISLQLDGHLLLSSASTGFNKTIGNTLLPFISNASAPITLWSRSNAILDAEGDGRLLVINGGWLRLEGLTLTGAVTVDSQFGGSCVYVQLASSRLEVEESRFHNSSALGQSGGCVHINNGQVDMHRTEFDGCSLRRSFGFAMGGAVSVSGGDVIISHARFVRTSAATQGDGNWAYGGGGALTNCCTLPSSAGFRHCVPAATCWQERCIVRNFAT